MAYLSLYRKYRSQSFSELIGQGHVVRTIQNGITSGRIAHAYLFTGPRGTGKTSTARLLAKALCCEKGPTAEPCNECDICKSITEGSCIDVYEMDAASESGVDDVRETIVEVATYQPAVSRYKVFVIDEVHDLSSKAFDALLKTIEEPPPHVVFILATTEYAKVPPTIRSRCQKFEFHRASLSNLVSRLEYVAGGEGVEVEPQALVAIAKMADGGYRDAMTLLEQAIISSEGKVTREQVYDQLGMVSDDVADSLLAAIAGGDGAKVVSWVGELTRMGRDPRTIVESLLHRIADLTRALYGVEELIPGDAAQEAATHEMAQRLGTPALNSIRAALASAHQHIRDVSLPRLWLEAELLRLAAPPAPVAYAAVAVPVERRQEPAPKEVAKPKPVVEPRAEPVAKVSEKPEVQAEEPPKASDTEEDAPKAESEKPTKEKAPEPVATDVWSKVLALLPPTTAVAKRLADTRLISQTGNVFTVEISKMNLDWLHDDPKRAGHVLMHLRQVTAPDSEVEYQVKSRSNGNGDAATVELPSEGQRLVDLTREVFGG